MNYLWGVFAYNPSLQRCMGGSGDRAIAQGTAVMGHWAQGEDTAVPTCCLCSALPPSQVDPYLPYEYTCEGMLERIHAYIQHQVGEHPCSPLVPSLSSLRNHPCSPWGSILVILANHPSSRGGTISVLPWVCSCFSGQATTDAMQSSSEGRLIAESTRRWGLGEVCHEQKVLGGCWSMAGDAGAGSGHF